MAFNVGDTVRLRSGGPLMTVTEIEDGLIICQWFDDKKSVQTRSFTSAALVASDGGPVIA